MKRYGRKSESYSFTEVVFIIIGYLFFVTLFYLLSLQAIEYNFKEFFDAHSNSIKAGIIVYFTLQLFLRQKNGILNLFGLLLFGNMIFALVRWVII